MISQRFFASGAGRSSPHTPQRPRPVALSTHCASCLAQPRHARAIPCGASDYNQRLQQARADDLEFSRLLSGPADIEPGRARSASDAGVLRRKGRLKEQDQFIDFIVSMHGTHSCEEVMTKVQRWVQARSIAASALGPCSLPRPHPLSSIPADKALCITHM